MTLDAQIAAAYPTARAMVSRVLRRRHDDVDDVVQEAALKAVRKCGQFRGESEFTTWFVRIAMRQALMHIRANKRRWDCDVSIDEDEDVRAVVRNVRDSRPTPEDEARATELHARVLRHLAKFPRCMREEGILTLAGVGPGDNGVRKSNRHRMRVRLREKLMEVGYEHAGSRREC